MSVEAQRLMVMSVHPRHTNSIMLGEKTIELRKTRPSVPSGQPVAIYATTPVRAVVATCIIERVTVGDPGALKPELLEPARVTSEEYESYFSGSLQAVALHLTNVSTLAEPITLDHIRLTNEWHPPQTWHFLTAERLKSFVGRHSSLVELGALL